MAVSKRKSSTRKKSTEVKGPGSKDDVTLGHPVPEVMTIQQLAQYLDLAVMTLYKKVQAHEIPFTKVGNLLRFTKGSIDQWLVRNTTMPEENLYDQFARLQNRYHFQKWLEGRGVDWRKLTDLQLADLAAKAIRDLREASVEPR